ncbi:MAG: 4Fe-4S dicluster domain-containing protein [Planctomycetes bacterium]|nr:4Fe-4S dicluster domain-containing protein [Planctomycetota bacterium]
MLFSLAVLAVVPLCGLARVDVWSGRHFLLFHEAPFKHALAGVIIGIAAMYVVTFLSNVVAGRMFCGWGCPVGQVSRFGEAVDVPGLKWKQRLRAETEGALFSAAFVLSVMAWWVDPRVFWMGSPAAMAWAWGMLTVGVVGAYAHGRWWRWEFCKTACPIGLYYSFVSPAKWYGVYFRNQHDSCIECDACDNVCPVDLAPRDLMAAIPARGGVSIADAPGRNHCLECGDCIRACERMIELKGEGPVPLLLGYHDGPQRIDREKALTAEQGQG